MQRCALGDAIQHRSPATAPSSAQLAPDAQLHASPDPASGLSPLLLPLDLRLTPEQFALVCQANPEAVLELAADGQLIAMTPTGGEMSLRNACLSFQLACRAREQGGWEVFGSSCGFALPDGSALSPDASVVRQDRWQALTPEQRRGFPPLCPDLVHDPDLVSIMGWCHASQAVPQRPQPGGTAAG